MAERDVIERAHVGPTDPSITHPDPWRDIQKAIAEHQARMKQRESGFGREGGRG